jgi:membrane protease YdiL (CAAX protease family)
MMMPDRPRFSRRGNPLTHADPGTPASRRVAVVLAVLLASVTIVWQNLGPDLQQRLINAPPPAPAPAQAVDEPAPGGTTDIVARVLLRDRSATAESWVWSMARQNLEASEAGEADAIRTTIALAEIEGPDVAVTRIKAQRARLLAEAAADGPTAVSASRRLVLEELDIVETIYTTGPGSLTPVQRERLANRYTTLGEFALTRGEPESVRKAVIGPLWPLVIFGLGVTLLFGSALLFGSGLLIYGIVWYSDRRTRMHCPRPAPGGSVMLETYALFVGGFAVLSIGSAVAGAHLTGPVGDAVGALALPAQWLLLLAVLWPLVRGMPAREWRQATGLTRGNGVLREIGCGVLVYLASVPLFVLGTLISVALMMLQNYLKTGGQGGAPTPPTNPVVELVGSGSLPVLIHIFTLATIWAPIAEELIFRGALYRHFRGRVHWFWAALGTALLFAYLHSYGPLLVAPLIALGFMFAFMREWRGSIIAPMTAHFLHNFTLLVVLITAFAILG